MVRTSDTLHKIVINVYLVYLIKSLNTQYTIHCKVVQMFFHPKGMTL